MEDRDEHIVGCGSIQQDINWEICESQGDLYKYVSELGYDIPSFSDLYLCSYFCEKAFDVKWTQHHDKFGYENWGYLRKELEQKMTLIKDGEKYFDECAYWVGFVYRYLYIETGIPSKKLKDIFPFAFIEKGFYVFCSEDIKVFINFICKKFNVKRIAYCD